jgi:enediyne biosynthesis protein E4
VSNFGPNVLYRNRGDGTFVDVTQEAGVGRGDKVGAGVAFLDFDGDGNLDLFAANYVKFSYENSPKRIFMGIHVYASPMDFTPDTSNLFHNNGDGTFADASEKSGIAAVPGTGMGMICADYDDDGRTDVFVANDVMPNFLWKSDGRGRFEEVGLESGVRVGPEFQCWVLRRHNVQTGLQGWRPVGRLILLRGPRSAKSGANRGQVDQRSDDSFLSVPS